MGQQKIWNITLGWPLPTLPEKVARGHCLHLAIFLSDMSSRRTGQAADREIQIVTLR